MLRRPRSHLRELALEPALAEALPILGIDAADLESELARQLHDEIRGTAAEQLPEIEVVVHCPIDPPSEATVEFGPRCESCSTFLGRHGERWCTDCAPACECCGRPASDATPDDCPEHAAALEALRDAEAA